MKRKNYDETLLIDLVAEGKLTYFDIAKRVGISYTHIRNVLAGRLRPELQPRILAAKEQAAEYRRRAAERCTPRPPHRGRGVYNDQLVVEMLASGNYTHQQIARRLGVCSKTIAMIASGRARPELQPKIAEAARAYQCLARQTGARYLRALLLKNIKQGLEGNADLARKCRNDAIERVWIHDDEMARIMQDNSPPVQAATDILKQLPPDLAQRVADALEELAGEPKQQTED